MNINPYSPTAPHYDSYEDFYKFFEIVPKETKEGMLIEVFPPVEQPRVEKREKVESNKDKESR
jgi:hypothetical protein